MNCECCETRTADSGTNTCSRCGSIIFNRGLITASVIGNTSTGVFATVRNIYEGKYTDKSLKAFFINTKGEIEMSKGVSVSLVSLKYDYKYFVQNENMFNSSDYSKIQHILDKLILYMTTFDHAIMHDMLNREDVDELSCIIARLYKSTHSGFGKLIGLFKTDIWVKESFIRQLEEYRHACCDYQGLER